MRQMIIYKGVETKVHTNIKGKPSTTMMVRKPTRVVRVPVSFQGFGKNGVINNEEFKNLANDLEPYNDGYDLT
jgi:hypothetical protein